MNLGVETQRPHDPGRRQPAVSAFSDESWGGDLLEWKLASIDATRFSIL